MIIRLLRRRPSALTAADRPAGHEQEVRALAWSIDGTALASASGDDLERIWATAVPEE